MTESIADLEVHRTALTGHCYRMLGSSVDADDAAQEAIIRAWRNLDKFDGRSSIRTWMYRIATNVCLDELADRGKRARPMEEQSSLNAIHEPLIQRDRTHWIEPIADARAVPADADPAERVILKQSIRLAFVSALQNLAPKHRAVLLLLEVLGWTAAEVAESLETSIAAVNSALQRARSVLGNRKLNEPTELSEPQSRMLNRYVAAFERYDVDELASLLRADAAFSMPPYALWLQGAENVKYWMLGPGAACRGSRMIPVSSACGSPAFAQYRPSPGGGHHAWALVVLELEGDQIIGWNSFLDTEVLFPKFDLPLTLPPA